MLPRLPLSLYLEHDHVRFIVNFFQHQLNSFYMLAKMSICWLSGLEVLEFSEVVCFGDRRGGESE